MAAPIPSSVLPTLHSLGSVVDPNTDVQSIATEWFARYTRAIGLKDVPAIIALFLDGVFWRDMLSLTWDFRTFQGKDAVSSFLQDQLSVFNPQSDTFSLDRDGVQLQQPFEDVAWIQAFFKFDTNVGHASGVFRLVPLPDRSWKAHIVYTNLEDIKGFPEQIGPLRNFEPDRGKWASEREREREFLDEEPTVVIVGGGQSGLDVAARLKMLGVNALVVERHQRIGDNWRKRYAALCLHDPVWYDHMPYLPVERMDIGICHLHRKGNRKQRKALVGSSGTRRRTEANIQNIPGQDEFKGQILHSCKHERATDHLGKKVAVVGACTSAHDLCADYVEHGVDVTMVQRGPTYVMSTKEGVPRFLGLYWEGHLPTDVADRVNASYPSQVVTIMHQRVTKAVAEADNVGFKLTLGEYDSGPLRLAFGKAGGYYFDVGASQLIIDGKIKLKSDGPIRKFTPTGLLFEDGSVLDADVVVFATGYGDARRAYVDLIKNADLHDKFRPLWGFDEQGEFNYVPREIGDPRKAGNALAGLWGIVGNLALCRFHSKHVALQIKAQQEKVFGVRYSLGNV